MNAPSERTQFGKLWRFLTVGVTTNAVLYGLLFWFLHMGMNYAVAATILYFLGIAWNFFANKIWSWRSPAPLAKSFASYVVLYLAIYAAYMGVLAFFVEIIGLPPFPAALISGLAFVPILFFAINRFIFKTPAA